MIIGFQSELIITIFIILNAWTCIRNLAKNPPVTNCLLVAFHCHQRLFEIAVTLPSLRSLIVCPDLFLTCFFLSCLLPSWDPEGCLAKVLRDTR